MSKMSESENRKKLINDLCSENLSDEEIVTMWKAPAIAMIRTDNPSRFKLEHFLVSKGVSKNFAKDYAPKLIEEAEIERKKTATRDAAGNFLTKLFNKLLPRKRI